MAMTETLYNMIIGDINTGLNSSLNVEIPLELCKQYVLELDPKIKATNYIYAIPYPNGLIFKKIELLNNPNSKKKDASIKVGDQIIEKR